MYYRANKNNSCSIFAKVGFYFGNEHIFASINSYFSILKKISQGHRHTGD